MRTWQLGVEVLLSQRGGLLNESGFFGMVTKHIKYRVLHDADSLDRVKHLFNIVLQVARSMGDHLDSNTDEPLGLANASVQEFLGQLYLPFNYSSITRVRNISIYMKTCVTMLILNIYRCVRDDFGFTLTNWTLKLTLMYCSGKMA